MKLLLLTLLPVVFCVPISKDQGIYDDALARTYMLALSAAAYSDNPQQCLTTAVNKATLKRRLNVHCDISHIDKCSGFSAVDNNDKAIILSFRGTNNNFQLLVEGDQTIYKNNSVWVAGGTVSKFFYDGFMNIWKEGMKNDFVSLANQHPDYQLWITGHSLGGALASLAASYIAHTKLFPADKITLVTFGQPRTGDGNYAAAHDNEVPNTFRVTHNHDLVPHVPLENMEGYLHHKSEVFYKEDMGVGAKYTVCSDVDESPKCSDGNLLDTSIADHLHYFNIDISEYGYKGCKN